MRVQTAEVVRAVEIGSIEGAAAAPVRYLESTLDLMMPFDPDEAFGQLHVRFRPYQIALAAARECARHDDTAFRRCAQKRLTLVPDQHLKLVQQRRAEGRLLHEGDLLLVLRGGGARRRERKATDVAIPLALVFEVGRIEIMVLSPTGG